MTHDHSHHNHHHPEDFNKAFCVAVIANTLFVILQIFFSWYAGSASLFADAIHNLGDVLSLLLSWLANKLMVRKPTPSATFGWKKTSIMAALANGMLLVFSCGMIVLESIYRFIEPEQVHALSVMIVAFAGVVVNGLTAMLFIKGMDDLNIKSAFLHLAYDALISAGVVVTAIIIYFTEWYRIDSIMALVIAAIILKGTWVLFTDSFRLLSDAVPRDISWQDVYEFLLTQPGVEEVHDLHIWALSTRENALSVHMLDSKRLFDDKARLKCIDHLKHNFSIHHVTIQVEHQKGACNHSCTHSPLL